MAKGELCRRCKGYGKIPCGTCNTTGQEKIDGVMQTCRTCNGRGGGQCYDCGGSGLQR